MNSERDMNFVEGKQMNYKSITCYNIPLNFLDKVIAKNHFSQFGKIKRFILRPKRLSCTVEYETENDAENAILKAFSYTDLDFEIRYTDSDAATQVRNIEECIDPDVLSELEAMGVPAGYYNRTKILSSNTRSPKSNSKSKQPIADIIPHVSSAVNRSDTNARVELEAILRKQAFNSEDKYRILDARDKLIRLTTVRQTDITKAVSTKGFCPDMCPEKERCLREAKHQVSSFEEADGMRNVMNHKAAIKEYSRSSADQESPLAHELRPASVLRMTMTYIMHSILDQCDDEETNLGDWYHFVWDRTRSIRKDVTQQELCSANAVELVEQCARFHIHCAARLIAEDPSVFDQKINTENLTKCLQTLKYMYQDLRLKEVKCPHEAEFRAYIILLNLNDTNFLWEVKQLPAQLQNSTEIRFALAVYLAMANNNYVKFFRYVKKTNYMNACILFRYFTQVRLQALKVMLKAYNTTRSSVQISINYLYKTLAFESLNVAVRFFQYYGMPIDVDRVVLERGSFEMPDGAFPMDRAYEIVEAKRRGSVGEAVCGAPLDPIEVIEKHITHNSFDESGYLRPIAWNAEDQLRGADLRKKITVEADSNLFKVPLPSLPISPKQQSKPASVFSRLSVQAKSSVLALPSSTSHATFTAGKAANENSEKASIIFPASNFPTQTADGGTSNFFFGNQSQTNRMNQPFLNREILGRTMKASETGKSAVSPQDFSLDVADAEIKADNLFKHFGSEILSDLTAMNTRKTTFSVGPAVATGEPATKFSRSAAELTPLQEKRVSKDILWMQTVHNEMQEKAETVAREKQEKMEFERKRIVDEREEQKKNENRREMMEQMAENSEKLLNEIVSDVCRTELKSIIKEEQEIHQNKLVELIYKQLLDNSISDELLELAKHEIHTYNQSLQQSYQLMMKYIRIWREHVRIKAVSRKLLDSTASWAPSHELVDDVGQVLHPRETQTLEMMRRYRLGVPIHLSVTGAELKPLDLLAISMTILDRKEAKINHRFLKARKFFKVVISLPRCIEESKNFCAFVNSVLSKIIQRRPSDHKNLSSKAFLLQSLQHISICLRKVEGIQPLNEENRRVTTECDHADAILFTMTDENLENSRKRLHHLMKLSQIYKSVPLAVLVYNTDRKDDEIVKALQLEQLLDDDKISEYVIIVAKNHRILLRETFKKCFEFLVEHSTDDCDNLEMQNLAQFMEQMLGEEFWKRFKDAWISNPMFRELSRNPNNVIDLYTKSLNHLRELIIEDLEEYPEFPHEFQEIQDKNALLNIPKKLENFPKNWKDPDRWRRITQFFQDLNISKLTVEGKNLRELEADIFKYTRNCLDDQSLAYKTGCNAVKHLLENTKTTETDVEIVSWLEVIKTICLARLQEKWSQHYYKLPDEIIYHKDSYVEMITNPWWFEDDSIQSVVLDDSTEGTKTNQIKKNPSSPLEKRAASAAALFNESSTPSAKRARISDHVEVDLETLMARGYALVENAEREIKIYKGIVNNSQDVAKEFEVMCCKQRIVNRSVERFLDRH